MRKSRRPKILTAKLMLLAAVVLGIAAEARAVEPKLLGITLRRYDYLGGRIVGSVGRHATLNMGIAQGIRPTFELWLFRKIDGQYRRIGKVAVVRVRQQTSTVESVSRVELKHKDLAVICADDLDIWTDNIRPLHNIVKERIIRDNSRNYYDTFDSRAIAKEIINERVMERNARVEIVSERVEQLRPDRPAFYAIARLRVSMLDKTSINQRSSKFDVNLNQIADPVTGRIVGFPISRVGKVESDGTKAADANTGISFVQKEVNDIREYLELDQFEEMRAFLGQLLVKREAKWKAENPDNEDGDDASEPDNDKQA